MSSASMKYQDVVLIGNTASPSSAPLRSGAGHGQIRGLERLGMPGHRPALARDVKAHRELSAGQLRAAGVAHEWQRDGVAPRRVAGRDRDAPLAAERDGAIGALDERRAREMQADVDPVERHRLRAEHVREAQARLASPDLGLEDHAERLIARARLIGGKRQLHLRLRRRGCRWGRAPEWSRPRRRPTSGPMRLAAPTGQRPSRARAVRAEKDERDDEAHDGAPCRVTFSCCSSCPTAISAARP